MLQTGSAISVQVPVWFAKQNECPLEMEGQILAETEQAIRFRGSVPAKQRSNCIRCGRELTHPVSLVVGIGPECAEHWGIDRGQFESMEADELIDLLGKIEFECWIPKSVVQINGRPAVPAPTPAPETSTPTFDLDRLSAALESAGAAVPVKLKGPSLSDRVERIFRETFAAKMDGYEAREPQIQMARLVAEGFETGQHVIAEAGTGTGKSFGLLVPAVLHAKKEGAPVIVSTGTIPLQEQYAQNDVPFLQRILDEPFTAVLAKGKGNYVCKLRLEGEVKQATLLGEDRLVKWAQETETGDVADYPETPDPSVWNNINVDDTCLGSKCSYFGSCHYFEAKRRASDADIVICNHHLFMADLQIKAATGGFGGVLPPACAVVFDEAHHLESIARDSLGVHISNYKLQSWIRSVKRLPTLIDPEDYDALQKANDRLFNAIATAMEEDRQEVPRINPGLVSEIQTELAKVKGALIKQSATFSEEDAERADRLAAQADEFIKSIHQAIGSSKIEDNWVIWAEREERAGGWKTSIHVTPIDVAPILKEALFDKYESVALTSATISVAGKFDHIKSRLGIDHALELNVESPFNYRENCLLYVPHPSTVPDPAGGNPDYHYQIAPMIEEILRQTDGRAFVLFTSYRGMQIVYDELAGRLRWQVLKQGDAPRSVLIERFKQDGRAVLFGTKTFWEGISIEGEALSCVIIDKLPFAVPSDPVSKAIAAAVERQGKSAFFEISLPEAVLHIKQGFGRLIRTKSDRGIVAILDKRIRTKPYGRTFLNSLPRAKRIEVLDGVEDFLSVRKGVVA